MSRHSSELVSFGFPVLITKGDLAVFEFEESGVAQGHAEDIGGQIFESCLAAADLRSVHAGRPATAASARCSDCVLSSWFLPADDVGLVGSRKEEA